MFAYCGNNPILNSDPSGSIPIPAVILATTLTIGAINNLANAIYYEFSDGESNLTSDSYTKDEHKTTWQEKLDYTKKITEEEHYNINAWRFYSEYTFHEYGWYMTGWAHDKNYSGISWLAERFIKADVYSDAWDERWYVNVGTALFGIIGW